MASSAPTTDQHATDLAGRLDYSGELLGTDESIDMLAALLLHVARQRLAAEQASDQQQGDAA